MIPFTRIAFAALFAFLPQYVLAAEMENLPDAVLDLMENLSPVGESGKGIGYAAAIDNPTDFPIRAFHYQNGLIDCIESNVADKCKGEAIYIAVFNPDFLLRFGFKTHNGFGWRLLRIEQVESTNGEPCALFTMREHVHEIVKDEFKESERRAGLRDPARICRAKAIRTAET